MNYYKKRFTEELEDKPLSELSDNEFAFINSDGERLFPMDTKERAQTSINKLALNLTPEQFKMTMKKLQMRYPGLQPEEKNRTNETL